MHEPLRVFQIDMNLVSLRPDYLRRWLERIAHAGYNAILWEVEDKIQWETCPDAAWPEAMSKAEFSQILETSRQLGLEPIPLLQTVGHGEYVLKQPAYTHMREHPDWHDCYCTSNPEVHTFLKSLIDEYLDLFGSIRYFHLGGDEAYVFGSCPQCRAAVEKQGPNALYAEHLARLAEPIRARSIRPGVWGDMLLAHPEQLDCLERDFIIWDWNYWDGPNPPATVRVWGQGHITAEQITPELRKSLPTVFDDQNRLRAFYTADLLSQQGYDVILCGTARCAGDTLFAGRSQFHALNILGSARKTRQAGLLGVGVTSWAVRVFHPDLHEFEISLAKAGLDQPDLSPENVIEKAGENYFGTSPQPFLEATEMIAAPYPFSLVRKEEGSSIQWNRLKDGTMPPAGHVASLIQQWQEQDNGQPFQQRRRAADEARLRIAQGKEQLQSFRDRVTTGQGRELLDKWLEAADLQARMNEMVIDLLACFAQDEDADTDRLQARIHAMSKRFRTWTSQWMTPGGTDHLAELIFTPLLESLTSQPASP